jgi:hypothetical protein
MISHGPEKRQLTGLIEIQAPFTISTPAHPVTSAVHCFSIIQTARFASARSGSIPARS